jgi:hypothetical protein
MRRVHFLEVIQATPLCRPNRDHRRIRYGLHSKGGSGCVLESGLVNCLRKHLPDAIYHEDNFELVGTYRGTIWKPRATSRFRPLRLPCGYADGFSFTWPREVLPIIQAMGYHPPCKVVILKSLSGDFTSQFLHYKYGEQQRNGSSDDDAGPLLFLLVLAFFRRMSEKDGTGVAAKQGP